jgi:hypothetical protein
VIVVWYLLSDLICNPLCLVSPATCRCLLREEFGTEELVDAATEDETDREFEPGGEEEGVPVGESLGIANQVPVWLFHLLQSWIGRNPMEGDLSEIFNDISMLIIP